jgi:hypothetical protein
MFQYSLQRKKYDVAQRSTDKLSFGEALLSPSVQQFQSPKT